MTDANLITHYRRLPLNLDDQVSLGHVLSALIFTLHDSGTLPKAEFLHQLSLAAGDLEESGLPEDAKKVDDWREHLSAALLPPSQRPVGKSFLALAEESRRDEEPSP